MFGAKSAVGDVAPLDPIPLTRALEYIGKPWSKHPQAGRRGQATSGQGRLPHPRLTLDGHQPRLPGLRPGDDLGHARELRIPADEQVQLRLPVRHAPTSIRPSLPAITDKYERNRSEPALPPEVARRARAPSGPRPVPGSGEAS